MTRYVSRLIGALSLSVVLAGCPEPCPEPPPLEERILRVPPGRYVSTAVTRTDGAPTVFETDEITATLSEDDIVTVEFTDLDGREIVMTYRVAQRDIRDSGLPASR